MSSSDAVFEAPSVYFQYVNDRAAHVKIDRVPVGVDLGRSKSPNFSCYLMALDCWCFMNVNQKALGV